MEFGEDTDVFVAFDSAMFKLTGVRAAEVANPMVCSILSFTDPIQFIPIYCVYHI